MLLIAACATEDPAAAPTTTLAEVTTTSAIATTTSMATTTSQLPATTVTTVPPSTDLINPLAGTLAGVSVDQGPVEAIIDELTAAYGRPLEDRGWAEDVCIGGITTRHVIWDGLAVYLVESESGQALMGYTLDQNAAVNEPIELPEGIALGMPYSEAASLYPDGAYHHDSLELDGVILQETPTLIVIASPSADGSAPIDRVWVGAIPTCH
jgi:hypothetical protein